jgi:regulator of PEP synthase PpsR (kinase-PPPase family)
MSDEVRRFHLHLVSDATGETLHSVARACLVQFEGIDAVEHVWPLIRTVGQMDRVLADVKDHPGIVLFTLVNPDLRERLREGCRDLQTPCIAVLDPIILALASFLGLQASGQPGLQHELDAQYFARIDAMTFALVHDDGQSARSYNDADVILIGVSRTSKTPTCIYLANRGIKAANVPIVPGCPVPDELLAARRPLVVGLTKDPGQLIQIRRNRLRLLAQDEQTDYVDPDAVREEVAQARRLCAENRWPVLDVTRRSIEETAATIIQMLGEHRSRPAAG